MVIILIIICEPQCTGFEHTEVNAALILAVSYAYPGEKILFLAEEEHLKLVNKRFQNNKSVNFLAINIPPRHTPNLRRLSLEMGLCKEVFNLAQKYQTTKVLFSSVTSPGLMAIKFYLRKYKNLKCVVIPHGILETIIRRPCLRPWELFFWFRFSLLFANLDRIHYLVLGESIQKELVRLFPQLEGKVSYIDHPYFYESEETNTPKDNIIRFGAFGVGHREKGTELFFQLAKEIHDMKLNCKVEFILVGHITDENLKTISLDPLLVPSPNKPLDRAEFKYYANLVDYAVFFYKPSSYRLKASGALFDAFSFIKPIIALRNLFFEYYFQKMGDIGYLCNNYDEMKNVIVDIINNRNKNHYELQRNNIIKGRKELSISKIGRYMADSLQLFWNR